MKCFAVSLLLLSFCAQPQQPAEQTIPTPVETLSPVERIGGPNERAFFVFATSTRHYTIRHDGFGQSYASARPAKLVLPIGPRGRIDSISYQEYEGDLLLLYELREDSKGWGYVERVSQRTLKTAWVTPISSYNLGCGLIESQALYITAADFIAKLDLKSGKYLWQMKDPHVLTSMRTDCGLTNIRGNQLVVQDDKGRTIELDKSSGIVLNEWHEN